MAEERWGGDELDQEDLAIPQIKLIQNVGSTLARAAGAEPGDFYCELTGEVLKGSEGFDMVVIAMRKSRTYWGRLGFEDEPPECSSLDSKTGWDGTECASCEHRCDAPWLLSAVERRTKCLVNYNLLGINLDSDLPVMIRTTGISAQATKQLYTQLSLNKQVAKGWYKAKVKVTSIPKKSAVGEAFAIKFGKLELLPDEQQKELESRSYQLLRTPAQLPEGLPEEEAGPEPLGYTPTGTPFYSVEERDKLMVKEAAPVELSAPGKEEAVPSAEVPAKTPTVIKPEPIKEEKKEPTKALLDLDF